MKPSPFAYHAPTSAMELFDLLANLENAKLLAGGQSLLAMINMRYVAPDHLIDINRVTGFDALTLDGDRLVIGATVRQAALGRSADVRGRFPLIIEALRHVGHMQTRSRGTFGGSLCHLDPAAELPTVALALDASVRVGGRRGARAVGIADWPLAYMTPNLESDEALTGVELQAWPPGHGHAFVEFARRHGDFAIVSVAGLILLRSDGAIAQAALALGGVDSRPVRLAAAERLLIGELPRPDLFRAAAAEARAAVVLEDAYYDLAYRRRLAPVLVERALTTASARAGGGAP